MEPPAFPVDGAELDALYELPVPAARRIRPTGQPIPGFATIKDSVIVSRGCAGGCTFCGLGFHQGKFLSSRSVDSVLKEIRQMAESDTFRGTVSDLGGPTANLYGARRTATSRPARAATGRAACGRRICPHFEVNEQPGLELLRRARASTRREACLRPVRHPHGRGRANAGIPRGTGARTTFPAT